MCGLGYAWGKCLAFATDWDAFCETKEARSTGMLHQSVSAGGFDIWSGEYKVGTLPRIGVSDIEKLLGKRGCVKDKHGCAREDLKERVNGLRAMIAAKRLSWDEAVAVMQMIVCGILSYAPLVGTPGPEFLHTEYAAFQRLILSRFGCASHSGAGEPAGQARCWGSQNAERCGKHAERGNARPSLFAQWPDQGGSPGT